jgi:hypothetical protein
MPRRHAGAQARRPRNDAWRAEPARGRRAPLDVDVELVVGDEAAQFFNKEKVAWTGNPIRQEIKMKATEGGYDFLNLSSDLPML